MHSLQLGAWWPLTRPSAQVLVLVLVVLVMVLVVLVVLAERLVDLVSVVAAPLVDLWLRLQRRSWWLAGRAAEGASRLSW